MCASNIEIVFDLNVNTRADFSLRAQMTSNSNFKSNYGVLLAWVPPGLRLSAKFIVIQKCCFLLLAWSVSEDNFRSKSCTELQ